MPGWLRWPRLWYATPTFVLFIALQAPDWRFTSRVGIALSVWAVMGLALDIWITRHRQECSSATRGHIRRLINATGIFGLGFGLIATLCAFAFFRPGVENSGSVVTTALNKALDWLGVLLPALDKFHRELIEMGRFSYAAYFGSIVVLIVVMWLPSFFLFYRTFANMPPAEFAKVAEGSPGLRKPPYGAAHRMDAWLRLMLGVVLLAAGLWLFARVLPRDAAFGRTYLILGITGTAINILVYIFHNYRRFLATLQPDGLLPYGREAKPDGSG